MNNNHVPCSIENEHFGVWKKVKHSFPYGFFFNYYELNVLDKDTGKALGCKYSDRTNKLDSLFEWICDKIK